MTQLRRTPLANWHIEHGAKMTGFAGWEMPLFYKAGILQEHLTVRRYAGLFDISHMGRFRFTGPDVIPFLQHLLTNDAETLGPWQSQYTILATEDGSARDDAYLFRCGDEYWLVVNAANAPADLQYLREMAGGFGVECLDATEELAFFALQGPRSEEILQALLSDGGLPPPVRNAVSPAELAGVRVWLSRTGYTGEPMGFEIFVTADHARSVWERLIEEGTPQGLLPVGLGARDTLRLEAGFPLFGQEAGTDPEGQPIPVFAAPSAAVAVSFAPRKGEFVGRSALLAQAEVYHSWRKGEPIVADVLRRVVRPLAVLDAGVARHGDSVFWQGRPVGWITSGTVIPYWCFPDDDPQASPTEQTGRRAIALAYIDIELPKDVEVAVEVRGRHLAARLVPRHGRGDRPPYFRPILVNR